MLNRIEIVLVVSVCLGAFGCTMDASSPNDEDLAQSSAAVSRGGATPLAADQCGPWKPALIDNVEDGDVFFGSSGSWVVFNDATGAQTPVISSDLAVRGGPRGSRYAVHSTGKGFTDWGAGFGVALGCGYDVGRYDGVRFKIKASGARQLALQLVTLQLLPDEFGGRCVSDDCNDFYQARLSVPDRGWYECTVPFEALAQSGWGRPEALDLSAVSGVQWSFGVEDLPYDVWVDDVELSRRSKLGCVPLRSSCD